MKELYLEEGVWQKIEVENVNVAPERRFIGDIPIHNVRICGFGGIVWCLGTNEQP